MLIEPLVLSLFLGYLRGGSVARLSEISLAFPGLIVGSFIVQKALPLMGSGAQGRWRFVLLVSSYLALLLALAFSRPSWGTALAAAGIFMNLVVVAANGGMPVSLPAARAIGYQGSFSAAVFADGIHRGLGPAARLTWLADIIPYGAPAPLRSVISIGDVFLALGVFVLVQENMIYKGKRVKVDKPDE